MGLHCLYNGSRVGGYLRNVDEGRLHCIHVRFQHRGALGITYIVSRVPDIIASFADRDAILPIASTN
jgi:hypothetical protein